MEGITIRVIETGEEYRIKPQFAELTEVFSNDEDEDGTAESVFRVSNQFINWRHLPLFHELLEAHNFQQQNIKTVKTENEQRNNWVHTFDEVTERILGPQLVDINQIHEMLRLAEYLEIPIIKKCIYHKLAEMFNPGVLDTSQTLFQQKYQIKPPSLTSNEIKKKYYDIFKALNYTYVTRIEEYLKK